MEEKIWVVIDLKRQVGVYKKGRVKKTFVDVADNRREDGWIGYFPVYDSEEAALAAAPEGAAIECYVVTRTPAAQE